MENKLNLGNGPLYEEGWTNVDIESQFKTDFVADVTESLPFGDDHFDYIVANHSLQMITVHDMPKAVAEMKRVLKPGGTLRVLVPDIDRAYRAMTIGDRDWFPVPNDRAGAASAAFTYYMTWYGEGRTIFTQGYTFELFKEWSSVSICGYKQSFTTYKDITSLDTRQNENIIFEIVK